MTPDEMEHRVAVCINAIHDAVPRGRAVPASWTRYCQGLLLRNALRRVDPEGEQATVLWSVIGRLGLVVAE